MSAQGDTSYPLVSTQRKTKKEKSPFPNPQSLLFLCNGPQGCGERGRATLPIPENSTLILPHQDRPALPSTTQGLRGESKASCTFRFLIIKNSSICFSCQRHRAERGCWAATATQKMRARVDWAVSRTAQCSDGILLSEGRQTPVIQPSNSDPSRNLHFPA